jgi:hypothetical protein
MQTEQKSAAQAAADRVIELEGELEASGVAAVDGSALESARAVLRKWLEGVTAVVASPALGRVTVIHGNGHQATITSHELAYAISGPIQQKPVV